MIRLDSDFAEIEAELDRLDSMPNARVVAGLEAQLDIAFAATQADVDVITGSLKASGKTSSRVTGDTWTGVISYGGASTGPNNPVDYAAYERARGGGHDFLRNVHIVDDGMRGAIREALGDA